MNYTKPQITSLASASSVIQGQHTKVSSMTDGVNPLVDYETPAAYEADE
jgi:hypothetical protein